MSEYNPLLKENNNIKIVEAAEIVYVQPEIKNNPHIIAKIVSDDIKHKTELSNYDGERYVKQDIIAAKASEVAGDRKANATKQNIKSGNQFDDAIDSVPRDEPTAPPYDGNTKSSINPEFQFIEKPYECEDYQSVYEDPNSLYKKTYGSEGSEYNINEYKGVYNK